MTCHFTRSEDGVPMIVCTRNTYGPDEMTQLKKAIKCTRWEICSKCGHYTICQELLAEGKEGKEEKC